MSVTPISHESVVYDVHDAKVFALLTDPNDGTLSPTYGPPIDVPGIADLSLDPNFATAQLKGDAKVIARKGRVDAMNFSATYGKVSLDVTKVLIGGAIVDAADSATYRLGGNNSLPYFGFAATINDLDTGLGSLHVVGFKVQLTGGRLLSGASDAFGQPTMQFSAQPANNGAFVYLGLHSALTALPATAAELQTLATAVA